MTLMITPGDVIGFSVVAIPAFVCIFVFVVAWVFDSYNAFRRKVQAKWKAIRSRSTTKPPGNV